MKWFSLPSILLTVMILTIANAKAQTCDNYSGEDSLGTLTRQCLNDILISYVTYLPYGFFCYYRIRR